MDIKCHICTGGTKVSEDVKALQDGVQVVVGTPGRVLDLIKKGKLVVKDIKVLVLDEADQMLDKGFKEQMAEVIRNLPGDV
jgi:superfamily II DNA/RNA helicase